MAGAGRAPKPVALKLIEGRGQGTDSGGRKVADTPKFKRVPPVAPEWLPSAAKAEWERIVPELSRLELLKPVDRAALTSYCLAWDRLVEAQKIIDAEGILGTNSQGRVRHPAVAIVEAASKELRSWAGEFGLTPSAENKLAVADSGSDGDDIFGK